MSDFFMPRKAPDSNTSAEPEPDSGPDTNAPPIASQKSISSSWPIWEKSNPKNREAPTKEQLRELSVRFSRQISPMGKTQIEYSWFKPFHQRPLQALPLWQEKGQPERYLTVEPLKDGEWRISTITLRNSGPAPVHKRQNRARSEKQALEQVRGMMGEKAPLLQRNAKWRLEPASEKQLKLWKSIRKERDADDGLNLSGEISDAIAKETFIRRVKEETL